LLVFVINGFCLKAILGAVSYYESRLAKVNLSEEGKQLVEKLDDELVQDDLTDTQKAKAKWTQLEALIQVMPFHRFVYIQCVQTRGIKACQPHISHNHQFTNH
jgi:hypothetical protein